MDRLCEWEVVVVSLMSWWISSRSITGRPYVQMLIVIFRTWRMQWWQPFSSSPVPLMPNLSITSAPVEPLPGVSTDDLRQLDNHHLCTTPPFRLSSLPSSGRFMRIYHLILCSSAVGLVRLRIRMSLSTAWFGIAVQRVSFVPQ